MAAPLEGIRDAEVQRLLRIEERRAEEAARHPRDPALLLKAEEAAANLFVAVRDYALTEPAEARKALMGSEGARETRDILTLLPALLLPQPKLTTDKPKGGMGGSK